MPNVLTLQISAQYTFPSQSYKAPKWQIWKCELGWFSLGQSHIDVDTLNTILQQMDKTCKHIVMVNHILLQMSKMKLT